MKRPYIHPWTSRLPAEAQPMLKVSIDTSQKKEGGDAGKARAKGAIAAANPEEEDNQQTPGNVWPSAFNPWTAWDDDE